MPNQNNERSLGDKPQRIIVIGASAGGFEALKTIVRDLPPDFPIPIFVVWHMAPDIRGVLPTVLSKLQTVPATNGCDREQIQPNHIYVAPPDHHLLIEEDTIRVTRGPKENRFRPAIDPLFRSASYSYGSGVIGIVLSGALDDGTAGLWRIKYSGGIAIVQDPMDAEVASMPESAMREVEVDYCVPATEIASVLVKLANETSTEKYTVMKDEKTKIEIGIAAENDALEKGSLTIGDLTPFTCPECHGVLSRITDGKISRFRCHTGHGFSVDTLLASLTENIEESLYSALRGIEESVLLLNHIGDHYAEVNDPKVAAIYFKKANEAVDRSEVIRQTVFSHERLTKDKLLSEAGNGSSPQER